MNVLKFFLDSFKKELDLQCRDWELLGSLFPEIMEKGTVPSREQATSRFADFEARKLLGSIANRIGDQDEYANLTSCISVVKKHSSNGRVVPVDAMRRLTRKKPSNALEKSFSEDLAALKQAACLKGSNERQHFENKAEPFLKKVTQEKAKQAVSKILTGIWRASKKIKDQELKEYERQLRAWCLYDEAKRELVTYVKNLIIDGARENRVLGQEVLEHYEDGCLLAEAAANDFDDNSNYHSGLGFVFSKKFHEAYAERLQMAFPYVTRNDMDDFQKEISELFEKYKAGDQKEEVRAIFDAVTMCIVAAFVGPASCFYELGRGLPAGKETASTAMEKRASKRKPTTYRARLQPIILTARDEWDLEGVEPLFLDKGSGDEIRLGRDASWIYEAPNWFESQCERVSRAHAKISSRGGAWLLTDCGSTNGTMIIKGGAGNIPKGSHVKLYNPGHETSKPLGNEDIIVLAAFDGGEEDIPYHFSGCAFRFEVVRVAVTE